MKRNKGVFALMIFISLCGCATYPDWLSASGASRQQIQEEHGDNHIEGIQLVYVTDALTKKLAANKKYTQFADIFPSNASNNYLIGPGDIIEVSIWEAPPALLFSILVPNSSVTSNTANSTTLPAQMVASDGTISIPFAGRIIVRGHSTVEIESDIAKSLIGKANQPQVLVRVIKNNTSNVTVVGDVNNSTMMPLTPKGERLLDVLAAAGGAKSPVNRTSLQLSRDGITAAMPLDLVIRDPRQNILLKPGDVITALFQSQSFSVLGATGKNDEISFEAQGISLAQALARSGGLIDSRADARGVFVFRFEDVKLIDVLDRSIKSVSGAIPVVYEINLRDPASFFVTQNFPVQNHDVIYVTNSPEAELQKFLRLVVTTTSPATTLNRALQ